MHRQERYSMKRSSHFTLFFFALSYALCLLLSSCRQQPVETNSNTSKGAKPPAEVSEQPDTAAQPPVEAEERAPTTHTPDHPREPNTRAATQKKIKAFSDADFTAFGKLVVEAIRNETLEQLALTPEEIKTIYSPGKANIILTGRTQWLAALHSYCRNKQVVFKGIERSGSFLVSHMPPKKQAADHTASPSAVNITGLHVKTTINGNPTILLIRNAFFTNGTWKILQLELLE